MSFLNWLWGLWNWLSNLTRCKNTKDSSFSSKETLIAHSRPVTGAIDKAPASHPPHQPLKISAGWMTVHMILANIFGKTTDVMKLAGCSSCHWTKWRKRKLQRWAQRVKFPGQMYKRESRLIQSVKAEDRRQSWTYPMEALGCSRGAMEEWHMMCDESDMAIPTPGRGVWTAGGGLGPASKGSPPPWCSFLMTSSISNE